MTDKETIKPEVGQVWKNEQANQKFFTYGISDLCFDDDFDDLQLKVEEVLAACGYDELQSLKALLKECKPYVDFKIDLTKRAGFTPDDALLLNRIKAAVGESEE